jgi:hypothetical protein
VPETSNPATSGRRATPEKILSAAIFGKAVIVFAKKSLKSENSQKSRAGCAVSLPVYANQ